MFRDDDGKPNMDNTLCSRQLPEDFADQKTCGQLKDLDRDIFVSCNKMYQYLEDAEAIVKITESRRPQQHQRLKKRHRTRTPEEQFDDRDEDAYTEYEEHISKRQDLDNASYKGSSSEYMLL